MISVDLSPGASPSFRSAPPVSTGGTAVGGSSHQPNYASQTQRLLSNRILRCIEKIVVTGGTLDLEALCLIPAQWVWRFQLALTVLDDGGNIMDAAVMAAIASLRHYRKPQVDLGGADGNSSGGGGSAKDESSAATAPILIPSHLKEPTPLPLHHTPLSISFAFVPMEDGSSHSTAASANMSSSSGVVAALVDPTDREELLQNGSLTVGMNVHAEVCLLDYGGGCELPPTQLEDCWKKAESCVRQLCTMLETSLDDADQQAQKDRLEKLKQQNSNSAAPVRLGNGLPPLPNATSPYFEQSDNPGGDVMMMDVEEGNAADEQIKRLETEAEEAYREQALDYSQGYKANKVREDDDHMRHSSQPFFNQASNLMKTLLASASSSTTTTAAAGTTETTQTSEPTTTTKGAKKADTKASSNKKKKAKPSSATGTSSGKMDSDEEESTQMLQSEFGTASSSKPDTATKEAKTAEKDDDSDIDDLAMAITKKKKKKKKNLAKYK